MKKIFLIGLLSSSLSFAHATTIDAPSSLVGVQSLNGQDAYEWGVGLTLTPGQQITSASITFTGTELAVANSSGTGYLYTDLLNLNNPGVTTLSDNDAAGDYFTSTGANGANLAANKVVSLNTKFFASVGTTLTWTITFTAAELAALNTDDADGIFDIGIDPDCHYTVQGLQFDYQTSQTHVNVPDVTMTAMLLCISVGSLLIVGRRLSNKQA